MKLVSKDKVKILQKIPIFYCYPIPIIKTDSKQGLVCFLEWGMYKLLNL